MVALSLINPLASGSQMIAMAGFASTTVGLGLSLEALIIPTIHWKLKSNCQVPVFLTC